MRFDAGSAGTGRHSAGDGADVGHGARRVPRQSVRNGTGDGIRNNSARHIAGTGRLPGDRAGHGLGNRGAR